MNGGFGPMAMAKPLNLGIAADTLLERALDRLHADLTSHLEAIAMLQKRADGTFVPIVGSISDAELLVYDLEIGLIIDIEDHLRMPESFVTANSPRWLREVIQRGRELRDSVS